MTSCKLFPQHEAGDADQSPRLPTPGPQRPAVCTLPGTFAGGKAQGHHPASAKQGVLPSWLIQAEDTSALGSSLLSRR